MDTAYYRRLESRQGWVWHQQAALGGGGGEALKHISALASDQIHT